MMSEQVLIPHPKAIRGSALGIFTSSTKDTRARVIDPISDIPFCGAAEAMRTWPEVKKAPANEISIRRIEIQRTRQLPYAA